MQGRTLCLALLSALVSTSCQPTGQRSAGPEEQAPAVVTTSSGAEMVAVSAGWFQMGSADAKQDEAPSHKVWIDAFLIDRYEVTQQQYGKHVLGNPSHFKGPNHPMEQVSWADAALYCNKRSVAEGFTPCYDEQTAKCNFAADGYRLPTEAEWEYACRAGSSTEYPFGNDPRHLGQHAWYGENAAGKTHPAGQKKPNAWGLYDMCGNVAEWCNDVYESGYYRQSPERNPTGPEDGEKYVLRGGAWNSKAETCRSAYRYGEDPGFQDACFSRDAVGFRCVRRPKPAPARLAAIACGLALGALSAEPTTRTALVYGEVYLRHDTGPTHPERAQRLTAILDRLRRNGLLDRLVRLEPHVPAEPWLTTVHAPEYVARVKRECRDSTPWLDSRDTPVCEDSYTAAVAAASGVLTAIDAVMAGKVRNAFCAVRPPGHHATRDRAMGFCLFGNVAVAARYVQKKHGLARVLVVDWDVHHGNGTQAAFYEDPTVLYFSAHRDHFYPGTGSAEEKGAGAGRGFTINVPLESGSGDADYLAAFGKSLRPAALAFHPDFVLVSAGFDAHELDPLGGMKLTAQGYAELTRLVKSIADECCGGRMVSVLEGGYSLEGLAASVEAHLRVMIE